MRGLDRGQQQRDQDADNRDDDQEFDQRKPPGPLTSDFIIAWKHDFPRFCVDRKNKNIYKTIVDLLGNRFASPAHAV